MAPRPRHGRELHAGGAEAGQLTRRPHGELIAVGIAEMKPASAGKAVDRLDDAAARLAHALLGFIEIIGIKDDERPSRCSDWRGRCEAARQAAIGELAVFGSI